MCYVLRMTEQNHATQFIRSKIGTGESYIAEENFHFEQVPEGKKYVKVTTIVRCEESSTYWAYDWQKSLVDDLADIFPDREAIEVEPKEITSLKYVKVK